ncbi:putative HVA22-like protein g [Henckelia pumila]|uniref:putative HVA22-like protein g n=1 Tax=Henckelia pumila TaxID=405737 RepID=UPI003C6E0EBD
MIGEFVTASLILVLGYAYPALQCFKSMEKNKVEIQELRFWCQYWIIVAILTILEKVGDVLVSWIPIYGELKLALFIFLWYPKTKGSGFIYESMLRPYVRKHELDIERSLLEFRDRAWNLAIYFWDNCTELGSTKILQFFQSAASRSTDITPPPIEIVMYDQRSVATPPPPSKFSRLFKRNSSDKRRSPEPYTPSKLRNHKQHFIRPEDVIYT